MRFFVLILFLCPLLLKAQDTTQARRELSAPILKFSHLSLIDPLQTIQLALEHPLGRRISLQHEGGYVIGYDDFNIFSGDDPYTRVRGFRLRNELRIYMSALSENRLDGFYFAPEFLYNFVRFDKTSSIGRDCNGNWNCQYYQYMSYRAQKQVFALHFKIGYQEIFLERVVFDIYGGYGWRHIKELNVHPPEGLQPGDRFQFDGAQYLDNRISISLGFKLGYLLGKRGTACKPPPYHRDGDYPYYIEQ